MTALTSSSPIGMLPGTLMYVYLGSLITNVSELAAGRTRGGAEKQLFYFAGLVATVAVTVYVTRIARRALAEATHGGSEGGPGTNPNIEITNRPKS